MIKLSKKEMKEIDEMLDKAEELVDKYGIYLHEAQEVVEGTVKLEEAIKTHNRKKSLKEGLEVLTFEDKAKALVDYLNEYEGEELTVDDCREGYNENIIELEDGREYIVCDIDNARELAKEDIEQIYDDLGLESFSPDFRKRILTEFINEDDARSWMERDLEEYCNELDDEELADEAINWGVVESHEVYDENSDEDYPELRDDFDREKIIEDYIDKRTWEEDPIEYIKEIFGEGKELADFISDNEFIDLEVVKDECIALDGIAHFIAGYDGEELELDGDLYAYRTN